MATHSDSMKFLEDSGNLSPRNSFVINRPTSFAQSPTMRRETLPGLTASRPTFADMLSKGLMLLAALAAYSCGGLLINFSVTVTEPPEVQFIRIELPAGDDCEREKWINVQLEPEGKLMKVADVPNGLAKERGVLQWDEFSSFEQDGKILVGKDKESSVNAKLRLETYLRYCDTGKWVNENINRTIDPAKKSIVTFDLKGVVVKKGSPYLEIGIILAKGIVGVPLLMFCLAFTDAGKIKSIFNPKILRFLLIPSLGWALGDVCEILANGKMNAAMYSVLSQARLVGTALCMFLVLGNRQTSLQLMTLVALSILIFCYMQVPDEVPTGKFWNGFGKPRSLEDKVEPDDSLGMVFALAKITISIVTGVVGQKALQDPSIQDMPFLALQAALFVGLIVALIPCVALYWWATDWQYGFFGGEDIKYWHCGKGAVDDAKTEECLKGAPLHVQATGWDYRTWIVMLFYIYRDCANNSVLRVFDAMIKNLVNAGATGATYALSLIIPPAKKFNITKCGLVCTVMLMIQMYASLPKPTSPTLGLPKPGAPADPLVAKQTRAMSEDIVPAASSQINIGLSTISSSEKKAETARY